MKSSKINELFEKHVVKWPKYYKYETDFGMNKLIQPPWDTTKTHNPNSHSIFGP
jgi:hypothetical protein